MYIRNKIAGLKKCI